QNDLILRRPFMRFWAQSNPLQTVGLGWRLAKTLALPDSTPSLSLEDDLVLELWNRIVNQSAESAAEVINVLFQKGVSTSQVFTLLTLFRARCLYLMKTEQWARVAASLL